MTPLVWHPAWSHNSTLWLEDPNTPVAVWLAEVEAMKQRQGQGWASGLHLNAHHINSSKTHLPVSAPAWTQSRQKFGSADTALEAALALSADSSCC